MGISFSTGQSRRLAPGQDPEKRGRVNLCVRWGQASEEGPCVGLEAESGQFSAGPPHLCPVSSHQPQGFSLLCLSLFALLHFFTWQPSNGSIKVRSSSWLFPSYPQLGPWVQGQSGLSLVWQGGGQIHVSPKVPNTYCKHNGIPCSLGRERVLWGHSHHKPRSSWRF